MNELTEGQKALQHAIGFECAECYDSGHLQPTDTRTRLCNCLWYLRGDQRPINQLIDALSRLDKRDREFAYQFDCARALVRATAQRPVRGFTLGLFLRVDERKVKSLIQTLRDEWALPIGSLRVPPYGYYWISTPEEFLAWFNPMKAQALSEMRTAHRLMRRHYPELAGQFTFNFEEDSPDERTHPVNRDRPDPDLSGRDR